jgi:hypothetical protein
VRAPVSVLTISVVTQGTTRKKGLMKKSLRLALLVCAGCAGLAFAGPALAKYDPSLTIEQTSYKLGAPTTVDVFIAISNDADPTAQLKIFSPAGYAANLGAAPGTKIGSVLAIVKAKQLGGALLPLAGDVLVANPTDPAIVAAATKCTGTATHGSIWVLNTSLQGQTVNIPVFVDKLGPLVVQTVCLPSPDVPVAAGGATFGAQLVLADFTIRGVFTNAGSRNGYEWAGVYTPYVPGTQTPNAAGTVEWRTYVGLPSSLTLAKAKTKKGVKLVGRLSITGLNPKGVKLGLYAGKKARPAPTATTAGTGKRLLRSAALPATGRYTIRRPAVKFTMFFQTRIENYATQCEGPSPTGQPFPCKGEDIAAVTSNQVKATKPKKKRRR